MSKVQAFIAVCLASFVEIADVFLKQIALTRLPLDGSRVSFPFGLALHKNPGIAFDIAIPLPIVFFLTFAVSLWLSYRCFLAWRKMHYQEMTACVLILLGACGNFLDRLIHGFTTDYLIFFRLSAINLSDILILLGMFGFLWYSSNHPQNSRI